MSASDLDAFIIKIDINDYNLLAADLNDAINIQLPCFIMIYTPNYGGRRAHCIYLNGAGTKRLLFDQFQTAARHNCGGKFPSMKVFPARDMNVETTTVIDKNMRRLVDAEIFNDDNDILLRQLTRDAVMLIL